MAQTPDFEAATHAVPDVQAVALDRFGQPDHVVSSTVFFADAPASDDTGEP